MSIHGAVRPSERLREVERAAAHIHETFGPTPQYAWPLLSQLCGAEVWVKHENATPIGAFKVRGGLIYIDELVRAEPGCSGVIAATRGNHGQSIAFAAGRRGLPVTIVVPHGNSVEKNAAMRALGAELIEHGRDFTEASDEMARLAEQRGLHRVRSFDPWLVRGVATYALELFTAVRDIDIIYVPIGLGSGIAGTIAVRDALGLKTEVVGVVSSTADAYALSFEQKRPVATESAITMADGLAVRVPDPDAVATILQGAARIVRVTDEQIAESMRAYFTCAHHVAEGAGAAAYAAALSERETVKGKKIAVILSGGNIDRSVFSPILAANQ